jgi:hypothetical protein
VSSVTRLVELRTVNSGEWDRTGRGRKTRMRQQRGPESCETAPKVDQEHDLPDVSTLDSSTTHEIRTYHFHTRCSLML